MKKLFFLCCLLTFIASRTPHSEAYVLIPGNNGSTIRWNLSTNSPLVQNGRVVYSLNPAGSSDVPFSEVERAIASSFQAWEDIPNSAIAFTRGANSTARGTRADNVFQLYWTESSADSEYVNFSGALAVTFVTFQNSGDLIDASLIFNGVDHLWSTDGRSDRFDIAETATHEIGHALGIAHSSIGGATMFPRTGEGTTRGRTLASDDAVAASMLYPVADFNARTGVLRGVVRDGSGAPIFGANVVASDANGNAMAAALSQPDGSYRIAGLPPGVYSVFAEPIDNDVGITFYGKGDLNAFYDNAVTNFLTTNDQSTTIRANAETALNFTVVRGTPAFNPFLVAYASSAGIRLENVATSVTAGTSAVVGLGGPGLPTSGTPLTISGTGITVTQTRFGTYSGGAGNGQFIVLDIIVAPNAAPGARTLFVSNGSQRAAIAGAVEIIGTGGPSTPPTLAVVSAANYLPTVALESVATVFGTGLANGEAKGRTNPLPTELNGVRVSVRDAGGTERFAPLFYISPTQINYQIPPGSLTGSASISFFNNGVQTGRSSLNLENVAPGLFTMAGTGRGAAAGLLLRIRANGQQVYEILAVAPTGQWQTLPIDWSNASDQLFLVLFGTGIRFRSSLNNAIATIGGARHNVLYAGAQGSLVGVDQVNVQLNRASVIGRGEMDVILTLDNRSSNAVRVNFK